MRASALLLFAACAAIGLLSGCANSNTGAAPAALVVTVDDYEAFVSETVSLLRGLEWRLRTVDRAGGLIETQPATSAHFPEFWRVDSPGGFNYLESSLATVRRIVTIRILPVDSDFAAVEPPPPAAAATTGSSTGSETALEGAVAAAPSASAPVGRHYRIQVEVERERYSAPERQVTTASGARGLYSQRTPTEAGYLKTRPGDVQWISLGRDELLEADLLHRIVAGSQHLE